MRIRATSPKNGSGDKSESGEGIPGAEMRSQILFQMDHCPAMFDNCHRYQGMTGPLKMAKQNSTKYRAVVEFKAASHPMSSYKVQIRATMVGGEFTQLFCHRLSSDEMYLCELRAVSEGNVSVAARSK